MNRLQSAEQFRAVLQLFAAGLSQEQAMTVAAVYDPWMPNRSYPAGTFVTWGENKVGDPQLYRVAQTHTSQADWLPEQTPALYTPIGLTAAGIPLWSRPAGAHDAYAQRDVVDFRGTYYQSQIDGNIYSPDEYPAGWEAVTE